MDFFREGVELGLVLMWGFGNGRMVVELIFREQSHVDSWCGILELTKWLYHWIFRVRSRIVIDVVIWNWLRLLMVWIRDALQWIFDCWNSLFVLAEEMVFDFCFYISPFLSVTARHLHAAALPLKSFFYGPLRGRRSTMPPSRFAR